MARTYFCYKCGKMLANRTSFTQKKCAVTKSFKCRTCEVLFKSRKLLWNHQQREHRPLRDVQNYPWNLHEKLPPWMDDEKNIINEDFKRVYDTHKPLILKSNYVPPDSPDYIKASFNFPVTGEYNPEDHLHYIFEKEKRSFKVNLSFGVILQHIVTGEFRYFVPYKILLF